MNDDPKKPKHPKDRFRNNYAHAAIGASFLKWQWQRILLSLTKAPETGYRLPLAEPDVAWLKANKSAVAVTWIGHATALVQLNGMNVLTDPMFSERASPFSFYGPLRKQKPALTIEQLPHIDMVLISHNHYDHLDRDSVLKLDQQAGGPPLFLVPLGIKAWMAAIGISNVRELDWWEGIETNGLKVHFVPVQHWSARGFHDRCATLWGGWVVTAPGQSAPGFSFFFTGDTAYSQDFKDIGARFGGFDLALIPIGAYAPRWFMHGQHVDPGEAVRIHQDIKAKRSVAIHWGTFEMSDEPLDEPPKLLAEELVKANIAKDRFVVLQHGETMRFSLATPERV